MLDYKKILEDWTTKTTYSIEKLEQIYGEKLAKTEKVFKDELDEENKIKYSLNLVKAEIKQQLKSKGAKWVGYVIAMDKVKDQYQWFRTEKALQDGIIRFEGDKRYFNDHDWRKEMEVPEAGDPKCDQRSVYLIAKKETEGSEYFRPVILQLREDKSKLIPPLMEKVSFLASGGNSDSKEKCYLNSVAATDFESSGEKLKGFDKFVQAMLPTNLVSFRDLVEKEIPDDVRKRSFQVFIAKANVVKLFMEGAKSNVVTLAAPITETDVSDIADFEGNSVLTTFMNKDIPLEFGENSEIYCVINKFVMKGEPVYTMLGYYVEKSTLPEQKPEPITETNSTAQEKTEEVKKEPEQKNELKELSDEKPKQEEW